ncbi:hypothetical protein TNCV_4550041 [Trichonephila clavipes]|nr:hypothetical protein TNCV_4550041 [Trichonephila clavipes]
MNHEKKISAIKSSTKFDHQVAFMEYSLCKFVKPRYELAVIVKESFSVRLSSLIVPLQQRKMLVKLFYQNGRNHLAALCEYRHTKDLRKDP